MALEPDTTLGQYEIVSSLGAGGMGEVYRARDTELGREVAIKLLLEEVASDPDRLARFEREARVLASLNHPHIVTIYSVETSGALRFLTMELVEGRTLAEILEEGPLPIEAFLELALAIADALSAAHRRGVTHRDLKPANIMVNDEGRIKVLDFGLAESDSREASVEGTQASTQALTGAGLVLGTVPYMSPEQLEGKSSEPPSDVFSFGVVLYEMATGERPFGGGSQAELISAILRDPPRSASDHVGHLPERLDRILERCLEKKPERRFPSGAELCEALAELQSEFESGVSGQAAIPTSGGATRSYRTPMVGREVEANHLREALDRASSGGGSLITLAGEPGVGKTRLASDLMDHARSNGVLTLVGHCYEGEGARPFSPWVEILGSIRVSQR